MTEKLFSYGTFKDIQVQRKLFGRSLVMTEAVLDGWAVFVAPGGYLHVRREAGSCVPGVILELGMAELFKADQWEEIPLYTREKLPVMTPENGAEAVWVYTRRDATGTRFQKDQIAALDHGTIMAAVEKLNAQLLFSPLPFCDMHVMLPCACPDRDRGPALRPKNLGFKDFYIKMTETRAKQYLSGQVAGPLQHSCLETIELIACAPGTAVETGRQRLKSYITGYPEKGLAVACLPIPACTVSPVHILAQMAGGDLRVVRTGATSAIPVRDWLKEYGLDLAGEPTALILLSETPAPDLLSRCFGGQALDQNSVSSAQSGLLYASDTLMVGAPRPFGETYEQRISQAAFPLGVMACHCFREAAAKQAGACPAGTGEGLRKTLLDFWP